MQKTKKKNRRSAHRIMSTEAKVLKFFRGQRKLSMRQAASLSGLSCTRINHLENGRADLTPKLILTLLRVYNFSYEQFMEYVSGKKYLPVDYYSECISILKRLDKEKLKTVKAILESF